MKTVKDYLDLGLVFVDDDMIRAVTTEPSYGSVSLVDCLFECGEYPSGIKLVGSMCGMGEWTPSSFAWRNSDGVKPEYEGLIDVEMKSGVVIRNKEAGNLMWSLMLGGHYIISKWRPVVLQSDDANKKIQEKFLSALRKDSQASKNAELRGGFKLLREHLENKPPFWNKSMPSFNCPCVAVNVETSKSTVSPREDKPMKPVYTAEMHARNELPPVDSKVKVCIEEAGFYVDEQDVKFEGKAVTVKAAFSNTESEKIVAVENEDGNCYCYIIECIKPIIKTIKVNGFDVPAPMSEAPEHRQMVYLASSAHIDFNLDLTWQDDDSSVRWLSRGLIHSTKSAAIAHAKAMLGIDPNV